MSADEIAKAKRLIAALRLPDDAVRTRRFLADARGRASTRAAPSAARCAPAAPSIDLAFRARAMRHPPLVALVDISGSMAEYSPPVPALPARGRREAPARAFLRLRDAAHQHQPRTGAPRSGRGARPRRRARAGLGGRHAHRRLPARLQPPLVAPRAGAGRGGAAVHRRPGAPGRRPSSPSRWTACKRSCRRLVWLNPLLRFDAFEARAAGIRAMLPHVHDFRPIHNLASMDDLCRALGADRARSGSGCRLRKAG